MVIEVDVAEIAKKLVEQGITNTPWSHELKNSINWTEALVEVLEDTYNLEYEVAKLIEGTKKENESA